jgi:hypothetical protein
MELLDRADHRDGLIGPLRQKHESVSGYFFCSFEFLFINYDNSQLLISNELRLVIF